MSTEPASSVTTTAATINGNLPDKGDISGNVTVSFEYGTTDSYGSTTSTQNLSAPGAFSVNLMELTPYTTYHFRAKAEGNGVTYGNDLTFNTSGTITTTYSYDVLGNLTQVVDNDSNTTTINYNWLSRKTSMTDPNMGRWYYDYDAADNLIDQVDAKVQAVNMDYDGPE